MPKAKQISFSVNDRNLQDVVICALRYALGRRTYITSLVPEFIVENSEIVDERTCIVMLRDLGRYVEDRRSGLIVDDSCDLNSWVALQNYLFQLARDRGYNVVGYEVR